MLPPANLGKKQNVIKRVSNCASCYRINSHHPTDHDRTLLRLQLHWLCGLRSSQNHRTLLEFICFAFGNNQPDVQSLSKLSRMFFVWLFIVGLWQMWWFGNFGAKKTTIQQQKDAVWHIISNPLDPTRRTNEDPPIPFLYWHGPQVMHLPTVHTNYMTCRYMMIHVACYCRAWNLTWHFHFDHTRSALSTVTSRLHLL